MAITAYRNRLGAVAAEAGELLRAAEGAGWPERYRTAVSQVLAAANDAYAAVDTSESTVRSLERRIRYLAFQRPFVGAAPALYTFDPVYPWGVLGVAVLVLGGAGYGIYRLTKKRRR